MLRTDALVSLLLLLTISKLFIYTLNSTFRSQLQGQHEYEYKTTAKKINTWATHEQIIILKGKAILVTGHGVPWMCETSRIPNFLDNRLTAVSEVVSLTRSWLRHYATSRTVAGSSPDEVIGFFIWLNPSSRSMVLGSTQPLTVMSTGNNNNNNNNTVDFGLSGVDGKRIFPDNQWKEFVVNLWTGICNTIQIYKCILLEPY
jgi:hypothetical protein